MDERFKNFTVLTNKISRAIKKIKSEEMQEFGLKGPHVSCLYYLYKSKQLTAKELTEICEEDKANISRSLVFLENSGYILCNSNLQKRYKSPLTLSEKGKCVAKKVAIKIDGILNEASLGIDEQQRKTLYYCLELISSNLEKICEKYEV